MTESDFKHLKVRREAYDALVAAAERRYTSKNDVTWSALIEELAEDAQDNNRQDIFS